MKHRSNYTRFRKPIHGFTLIELLVVIAIIALLLSIIIPSLNRARGHANKVICSNNIRQIGLTLRIYAKDNNGIFPLQAAKYWPWDVSYWTTDLILEAGAVPDVFYCPSNQGMKADDVRYWRYSEMRPLAPATSMTTPEPSDIGLRKQLRRVTSYFFILDTYLVGESSTLSRNVSSPLQGVPQRNWIYRQQDVRSPSSAELITDSTINQAGSYSEVYGGMWDGWGKTDSSNHLTTNKDIEGANVLFVDGSAEWRPADQFRKPDGIGRVRLRMGSVDAIW